MEDHGYDRPLVPEFLLIQPLSNRSRPLSSAAQVVEVQEKFDTSLVTASRIYVRDGDLIKMCRKGPKRFFFVLFNDLMVRGTHSHHMVTVLHTTAQRTEPTCTSRCVDTRDEMMSSTGVARQPTCTT